MGIKKLGDPIFKRERGSGGGGHAQDQIISSQIEKSAENIHFIHKVAVERPFADIRTFSDIFDGTGFNTFGIEDIEGSV